MNYFLNFSFGWYYYLSTLFFVIINSLAMVLNKKVVQSIVLKHGNFNGIGYVIILYNTIMC